MAIELVYFTGCPNVDQARASGAVTADQIRETLRASGRPPGTADERG